MLNRRGGIECDFTVTRVAEEQLFQIVTGTAFGNHDASWIRRHLPDDGSVRLERRDLAGGRASGCGARGRATILSQLTPDPLDFRYMSMREIAVGDVPVRALRVTFVGEAGWELYCPTEYGAGLWQTLWEAGRAARIARRRLPSDRLAAAREGLPRVGGRHHRRRDPVRGGARLLLCADDKEFIGSDALRCGGEPERRLRCIVLEDPRSVALGNEPVRIDGCGRAAA